MVRALVIKTLLPSNEVGDGQAIRVRQGRVRAVGKEQPQRLLSGGQVDGPGSVETRRVHRHLAVGKDVREEVGQLRVVLHGVVEESPLLVAGVGRSWSERGIKASER